MCIRDSFTKTIKCRELRKVLVLERLRYPAPAPQMQHPSPASSSDAIRVAVLPTNKVVVVVHLSRLQPKSQAVVDFATQQWRRHSARLAQGFDVLLQEEAASPWRPQDATTALAALNSAWVDGGWRDRLGQCLVLTEACTGGAWWRCCLGGLCAELRSRVSVVSNRSIVGHLYGAEGAKALIPEDSTSGPALAQKEVSNALKKEVAETQRVLEQAADACKDLVKQQIEVVGRVETAQIRYENEIDDGLQKLVASISCAGLPAHSAKN
eukprot:TRINITY_DN13226_c0_g1_i2.p1 TRINITY_DN13226_c0_g1~~TRINITY_DN13226_c0_g1_i2.p1  ORF type:complete len:267 (-),score=44.27 TRINITY_DN13226_c0_g1_i2:296-1096(-)